MNNNPLIAGVWRNSEFVTISKILERTKNVGGGTLHHNFYNILNLSPTFILQQNKTKGLNSRIG